jgi:hypothetical protein
MGGGCSNDSVIVNSSVLTYRGNAARDKFSPLANGSPQTFIDTNTPKLSVQCLSDASLYLNMNNAIHWIYLLSSKPS